MVIIHHFTIMWLLHSARNAEYDVPSHNQTVAANDVSTKIASFSAIPQSGTKTPIHNFGGFQTPVSNGESNVWNYK